MGDLKISTLNLTKRYSNSFQLFLMVHSHRVFRGFFIMLLLFHMILLLVPWIEIKIPAWPILKIIFAIGASLWPFPTFDMLSEENLYLRQVLMKTLEISVIMLYAIDLLPKIFIWRQNVLWKFVNIVILSQMMFLLPVSIIAYDKIALPTDTMKLRIFSISFCFVIVCEILSIREQKSLRFLKINQRQQEKQRQIKQKIQEFSWCEIVKHDTPNDCWIVIKDKIYDVTQFLQYHPGGNMILDGAGGDCTALWYSYHPSKLIKQDPPQQYMIGKVRDYQQYYSYDDDFYQNIKEEVEQMIPRNNWQNHWILFVKGFLCIIGYLACLYYYVNYCTLLSAILLGFFAAQADVNIMHDGNHYAFSSNKTLSFLAGYVLDLTFSTSVVYRRSHNFGHHSCVNHLELDRAFDTTFPYIRLHPLQQRFWYHKYQHLYIWIIYTFVNFTDVFGTFDEMQWFSNYPCRRGYVSKLQVFLQIIVKILWISLTLIYPSIKFSYKVAFGMWFVYNAVHSYNYALYFSVNHWTLEAGVVDNQNINQTNWGKLQIQNSSNFALDSFIWTHLSGGLNYQIEHHLFPQFAHTRLKEIKSTIQVKAQQAKIKYFEFPSFLDALISHYKLLKILGSQDKI
ncbi:unnamed protein product [Paramecium pentaurelia]|uniref:Cytochrome b5 heme-binding domain-containing protein n=1 Tax=Paramecium pentaurelia TaxID=43138 RepID=A0A8S1W2H5_9CILI|nr:unnamed protein product [Paramecium pentaurelia]